MATLRAPQRVLPTLNNDGTRRWIRPRLFRGRYYRYRLLTAWFLIALFAAVPFVRIGGKTLMLLDVRHWEFTLFGRTFFPTDGVLFGGNGDQQVVYMIDATTGNARAIGLTGTNFVGDFAFRVAGIDINQHGLTGSWYQAATDGRQQPGSHVHAEFFPAYRARDKLKYLAGTELAAGMFASDVLPEDAAARLRSIAADDPGAPAR